MSRLQHIMQIKDKKGPTMRTEYKDAYDCHFEAPSVFTQAVAQGAVSKPILDPIPVVFEALPTDAYDFSLGDSTQMDQVTLIYLQKPQGQKSEKVTLKITLSNCFFVGNVGQAEAETGLAQIHTSIGFKSMQLEAFQYDYKGKQTVHKTFKYDNLERLSG